MKPDQPTESIASIDMSVLKLVHIATKQSARRRNLSDRRSSLVRTSPLALAHHRTAPRQRVEQTADRGEIEEMNLLRDSGR